MPRSTCGPSTILLARPAHYARDEEAAQRRGFCAGRPYFPFGTTVSLADWARVKAKSRSNPLFFYHRRHKQQKGAPRDNLLYSWLSVKQSLVLGYGKPAPSSVLGRHRNSQTTECTKKWSRCESTAYANLRFQKFHLLAAYLKTQT